MALFMYSKGDVELSTILIQYRADVSLRTPDRGANALHIAVEQGHSDLVRYSFTLMFVASTEGV